MCKITQYISFFIQCNHHMALHNSQFFIFFRRKQYSDHSIYIRKQRLAFIFLHIIRVRSKISASDMLSIYGVKNYCNIVKEGIVESELYGERWIMHHTVTSSIKISLRLARTTISMFYQ